MRTFKTHIYILFNFCTLFLENRNLKTCLIKAFIKFELGAEVYLRMQRIVTTLNTAFKIIMMKKINKKQNKIK